MTTVFPMATAATLPHFSALFELATDYGKAELRLRSHCTQGTITSVIHERTLGTDCYTITYDADFTLSVSDGESLTIIVRNADEITGNGVFQVDTALVGCLGALLIPRSTSNLLLDQCETQLLHDGIEAALKRCQERSRTEPLPDECDQAVVL